MRLRQAFRALRATPGITIASIVILALGIGASTAVFSIVNGMLLRPLPVTAQDRLVRIWQNDVERGFDHDTVFYPEYLEWTRRSRTFESLAALWAFGPVDGLLLGPGEPTQLSVSMVSGNFFSVLGSSAELGRPLRAEDDLETAVPPLVLSYRAWRERFGSDPSVVGSTIPLRLAERISFRIVGVMPEAFDLFEPAEAWAPILAVDREWAQGRICECDLIGRLASGATPDVALAELQAIHENLAVEKPGEYRVARVVMVPLLRSVTGGAGRAAVLAFGAAGLLLFIAVANVAGLSVIRALGRGREVSIRSALGAGTSFLLRERLMESALISAAALGGAFIVAYLGIEALIAFKGADLPRVQAIALDGRALLFGTLIAALATTLSAALPMTLGTHQSLTSRRFASHGRVMQWMVVGEIALALPLLFASALLAQTLHATASIDRGFDPERLLTVKVPLAPSKYPDPESKLALFEELVARVEAIPGVASVTTLRLEPGTAWAGVSGPLSFEGQAEDEARTNPMTNIEMVPPNYFAVLGIPILRGRAFSPFDRLETERVAIVSEEVATTYWPGEDPIGKDLGYREIRSRVVGVVGNTRYRELTRAWPTVYFSMRQNPFSSEQELHPLLAPGFLAVRTRLPAEGLVASIRSTIRGLDEEIALDQVATMHELLNLELRAPTFNAAMISSFSFIALLLAAAGVYSVFAAFVAQRLPELGIRSALGATPSRLRGMVLGRSRNLVLAGILAGGVGSFFLSRVLESFLYGVEPFDLPTLVGAAFLIAVVSLMATAIPAHRAARVDPMLVLKQE